MYFHATLSIYPTLSFYKDRVHKSFKSFSTSVPLFLCCKWVHPRTSFLDSIFKYVYDAKAETPVLWPPCAKSWLIRKDSDARRGWGQEEKGMTEDEMAGWHHGLDGCESEWTPGVGEGRGGLVCCDSRRLKESDTTEWLNWTELKAGKQ